MWPASQAERFLLMKFKKSGFRGFTLTVIASTLMAGFARLGRRSLHT